MTIPIKSVTFYYIKEANEIKINDIKTTAIVVAIVVIAIAGLFAEVIQHPEILCATPTENPPFIAGQEIPVQKMAGAILSFIIVFTLLELKAIRRKDRCAVQRRKH